MFNLLGRARKSARLLISICALGALAACDAIPTAVTPQTSGPASSGDGVKVALLVPYGSGVGGDEGLARSLENAARLAVADLGAGRVALKVYATGGNAGKAAAAADRAIAEGAEIIVGPLRSDVSNAAAVAASDDGVNVLSFSNNQTIAGGNLFILGNTFENIATRLLRYSRAQGRSRMVVASPQTPVGQIARQSVARAASRAGVEVVENSVFEFSQQGIVAAVPQIAASVRNSGANALFLTSDSTGALPLLAQLLPEQGVDPATIKYLGLTRWDVPSQTLGLRGLQGGWFALSDPTLTARFNARYQSAYGTSPHPLAGLAYDGVAAVGALAAKKLELSTANLRQRSGYVGVNGIFRFQGNNTTERALAVAQVTNGQVQIIDSAPRSFGRGGS